MFLNLKEALKFGGLFMKKILMLGTGGTIAAYLPKTDSSLLSMVKPWLHWYLNWKACATLITSNS